MGFLPQLSELNRSKDMISEFGGYNHNLRIGINEFYDMQNMSSDNYPTLSPRKKRRRVRAFTNPHGLYMHNELCWVDGTKFYYGGVEVSGLTLTNSDKTIIGMGNYVLIFPDKAYYKPAVDGAAAEYGTLGNSVTVSGVTASLTKISGDPYSVIATQATAPVYHEKDSFWCNTANTKIYRLGDTAYTQIGSYTSGSTYSGTPTKGAYWLDTSDATKHVLKIYGTAWTAVLDEFVEAATQPLVVIDGSYWLDTSTTPHSLKQYSTSFDMWNSIATTYIKLSKTGSGLGAGFQEYDGVTISGFTNTALNGEFTVYGKGDDYIIITAIIDASVTEAGAITITRDVPTMHYVTELKNRIWGCNSAKHEVYACKQGDPKVWKQFLNISTDSYTATIGSRGDFTGAVNQLGSVLFLKEDVIHELYGTKPANYQLQDNNVRGVQAGCEKSIAIVNETLFYKSRQDVCSFGTSVPRKISAALGSDQYTDAVGGRSGSKYYLSMKDKDNTYRLFVYDIEKDMWHVEDNTQIKFTATVGNDLYFIASDNIMYSVNGLDNTYDDASAAWESDFEWYAETGELGLDIPDKKYISKLQLRLKTEYSSDIHISVMYDDSGEWEETSHIVSNERIGAFNVIIKPRRCDTMRIKIHGTGEMLLYSIAKTVEQGSEK